jgi:hypothetical protein
VKTKTAELTGTALDWAVLSITSGRVGYQLSHDYLKANRPSTDWSQGGPIIERELLMVEPVFLSADVNWPEGKWVWRSFVLGPNNLDDNHEQSGPTPLVAAMRCFTASVYGDEVDVPEELLT